MLIICNKLKGILPFCFLLLLLFLTGCKKSSGNAVYDEYTDKGKEDIGLSIDNVFEVIELEELYELIEAKETFYVYYGQVECPYCKYSIGFIDIIAKENGISCIYYLESELLTTDDRDEARINEMMEKIAFDEDNNPLHEPQLWLFDQGVYIDGMLNYYSEDDPDAYNCINALITKYLELFKENADVSNSW